jgi:acylphosphatase
MAAAKKSICASITDHVQLSGFRDVVEIHGKARGLKGLVFSDVDGSVKIMASGPEQAISGFIHDLKISRPDTIIETRDIIDNIPLPEPFSRVVAGDLREISERLDMGVNILAEHTGLFHGIDNKLGDMGNKLGDMGNKFDDMSNKLSDMGNTLNSMNEKFDTLPERIAEAMKK